MKVEKMWFNPKDSKQLEGGVPSKRRKTGTTDAQTKGAATVAAVSTVASTIIATVTTDAETSAIRQLLEIDDLSDVQYFLHEYTGGWVLCPQELACWDSKSLWFAAACILCFMCMFLFVLVYGIGFDKSKAHGEERRRCCCGHVLCILGDRLEMACGENGALALVYVLIFGTAGAVQVFALGYDASVVALFYVGIVLALLFVGGALNATRPQLYETQRTKGG